MIDTETVWKEFRDRLKGFILRRVAQEQDAEDILQEVFLRIHARLNTLKDRERLEAWLFQITRNAITEHYRRQGKAAEPVGGPEELEPALEAADLSGGAGQEPPGAEGEEAARLIGSCLLPMLSALPEPAREALVLTEVEQVTQKEMADRLGLSFSGAKSRVQRAREKLKDVLLACCHVEFDRRGNVIGYELRMKAEDCRFCSPESGSG